MTNHPDDRILSIFTLSLLQDTGWYEVDFQLADMLIFGYGEKCNLCRVTLRWGCMYETANLGCQIIIEIVEKEPAN